MPRDPNRIDIILEAIRKYWKRHPSLRLSQIVGNFATTDPYYFEDSDLLEALNEAEEREEAHDSSDS